MGHRDVVKAAAPRGRGASHPGAPPARVEALQRGDSTPGRRASDPAAGRALRPCAPEGSAPRPGPVRRPEAGRWRQVLQAAGARPVGSRNRGRSIGPHANPRGAGLTRAVVYWSDENRTAPAGIPPRTTPARRRAVRCRAPTTAPSPITAPVQDGASPMRAPAPTRESRDDGAGFDDGARQDRAADDPRARRRRPRPRPTTVPPVELGVGATWRVGQDQAVAAAAGDGRGRRPAEHQVGGAADEGRRGAEVQPVRGVDHALEVRAGGQQPGERLALDRDRPAGRDRVDHRAAEDVAARVDLVGDDLLGGLRLLQERRDPAVLVGGHQPERARVRRPG